ncbi:MAG TPA: hypothetical protein ENN29_12740 [Candidatus Hydrogenedentes bacterium]|nr:hypothetical protein [Candidatus Hydrogenedentota bacterium]
MSNDMHTIRKTEDNEARLAQRDAETQMALGIFISILAVPVLIGSFWADDMHSRVVNITAGAVLLGIGLGLLGYGWTKRSRLLR